MTEDLKGPTVYDDFLHEHGDGWTMIDFGQDLLTHVSFVEPCLLVPSGYLQGVGVGSRSTIEMIMTAAWEALEPMSRHGLGPALGAQTLAALGGNPLRADGDPRRYVRLVLSALVAFQGRGLDRHEGRAYVELGRALMVQRWIGDALRALDRGRVLLERAGDDHGLRAVYARLAALESRVGLYEQALLHAEEGLQIGTRLNDSDSAVWRGMGYSYFTNFLRHQQVRALTRIGFVQDAEAALTKWRDEFADVQGDFNLWLCEAELRMRQQRIDDALGAYIRAIESRFANLDVPSLAGRSHYLENGVAAFTGAVGAALASDRPEVAVAILSALHTGSPSSVFGETPFPAAEEPGRSVDAQLVELARRATSATVARDRAKLFDHNDRARMLLETRSTALRLPGISQRVDRKTIEEVAVALPAALAADELALYYGQTDDGRGVVFAICDGAVDYTILSIAAEEIDLLAKRAHEECVRRTGTDNLRQLAKVIFEPVADRLARMSRVYVTAHGALEVFPFHAAPFRGHPLVTAVEVRALPSLGSLWQARAGGPVAVRQTARSKEVVVTVRQPRYELLPDLPAIPEETEAVRVAFPAAKLLEDDVATVAAAREVLATADVLHVAGHAMFEPELPYLARILLADRPLFAFEVFCAGRTPRFVNLSCCRAGAEQRSIGGEGEGLAAAFLAAGSETVIAPLWPVRDDAALAFNQILYRELARPEANWASATRTAQLTLLAQPQFAHPGLWGAFTILGRI